MARGPRPSTFLLPALIGALAALPIALFAPPLNVFSDGTVASAAAMNANFQGLSDRIALVETGEKPLMTNLVEIGKVSIAPGATVVVIGQGVGGAGQLRCPGIYAPDGTSASSSTALLLRVNVSGHTDTTQVAKVDVDMFEYGNGQWNRKVTGWNLYGRDWTDNYQDMNLSPHFANGFGSSGLRITNKTADKTIEIFAAGCVVYGM